MKNKQLYLLICFSCIFSAFYCANSSIILIKSSKFVVCSLVKEEVKQSNPISSAQNFIYLEESKDEKNSTYHYLTLRAFESFKKTNRVIDSTCFNLFSHSNKSIPIIIKCHSLRI